MPRAFRLTWQPGIPGRPGRWRKKYRRKVYHFPGGSGKYDREAYDAAVAAWEILRAKIDLTAPRKHQRDYEAAIAEWEKVLAWSSRYGDKEHADQAEKKLASLRRRFELPKLLPLAREDRFESNFDSPWLGTEALKEFTLAKLTVVEPLPGPGVLITPASSHLAELDGSPLRIAREMWQDRLAVQDRKAAAPDESLGAHLQTFLTQKANQAKAGQVTTGRVYALRLHLEHFRDWLGKDTNVKEIDGGTLTRFYSHVLEKMTAGDWGKTTAAHYMTTVKSFVRWLWQSNAIPTLPRVLDGRSQMLKITKSRPGIVTFTVEEIKALLTDASDRTKLYILLMLNCGMTQKDISDLLVSEVDWKEGRIIRKRSKTSDEENVPTVNYKLWPETFRLLQQERDANSQDRVLVNSNGGPLWSEETTADGKYKKNDNVKNAFERLRTVKEIKEPLKARKKTSTRKVERAVKATIDKPLKSLKKTSASLLRDNAQFASLEGLFLGHAPQSMSDKHYTKVPQKLLDQAVQWLGEEYGLG